MAFIETESGTNKSFTSRAADYLEFWRQIEVVVDKALVDLKEETGQNSSLSLHHSMTSDMKVVMQSKDMQDL